MKVLCCEIGPPWLLNQGNCSGHRLSSPTSGQLTASAPHTPNGNVSLFRPRFGSGHRGSRRKSKNNSIFRAVVAREWAIVVTDQTSHPHLGGWNEDVNGYY